MAAIEWEEVLGQKFTGEEARDASDFAEIVWNFALSPDESFKMFVNEGISVGKRLYFAAKASDDNISVLLLMEKDARVIAVIKSRLQAMALENSGGIITSDIQLNSKKEGVVYV